jgi:hypothetical protein
VGARARADNCGKKKKAPISTTILCPTSINVHRNTY